MTQNMMNPDNSKNLLSELLKTSEDDFIPRIYNVLLKREPDWAGLQYYRFRIQSGVAKEDILLQIAKGEEFKRNKLEIPGLEVLIKRRQRVAILRTFLQMIRLRPRLPPYRVEIGTTAAEVNLGNIPFECKVIKPKRNTSNILIADRFDRSWYLEQNADVRESGINPEEHYLDYGKAEGRNPRFDHAWYLSEYPDVAAADTDPLLHYINHGKSEGRHPVFNKDWYLSRYPDVGVSQIDALDHYIRHGKAEGRQPAYSPYSSTYEKWVRDYDTLTPHGREVMRNDISLFENLPLISLVMPVYNPNPDWLTQAIESVLAQVYQKWELCIADDCSTDLKIGKILEYFSQIDARIKVVFRQTNGHISQATNSALLITQGDWIALLDHDDVLPNHALYWVAKEINDNKDALLIYSDEDKITEDGVRFEPYFKSDWNRDLFYSHNMFGHLGVYHAKLVSDVGGFREGLEGSQDYDLVLRCIEKIEPRNIRHIPRILYHWRFHAESTSASIDSKPYAMIAGQKALSEHFVRQGIDAKADLDSAVYRVRYALPAAPPLVSLIIPTRNGLQLLTQCIDSIVCKTTYKNYEIVVIDNGSDHPDVMEYLEKIAAFDNISVIRDDGPFNYSRLNNMAVNMCRGEIVGLVNNDIEVIDGGWLEEMVSHALRPEIGAVGARLWYPNDTLQHGGVILGLGGVAGHSHKHLTRGSAGYMGRANCVQSFSAVTAACLLVRRSTYQLLGGLNDLDLKVAFNDVDFCIRLCESGYTNIWTPYANLYHHESASRGLDLSPEKKARFDGEVRYMKNRWAHVLNQDPAYSPNLTLHAEDFSLAWPPRLPKPHTIG